MINKKIFFFLSQVTPDGKIDLAGLRKITEEIVAQKVIDEETAKLQLANYEACVVDTGRERIF